MDYSFKGVYPVDMTLHMVTQGFGEHPEWYVGYGQRGHNGLDMGPYDRLPHPFYATDAGSIREIHFSEGPLGYDAQGFGNWLSIQHTWGQSLYAHASRIDVKPGQYVQAKQQLGMTGGTGNCKPAGFVHMHLGIYPTGEPDNNGYNGAVDPQPHMLQWLVSGGGVGPTVPPNVIPPAAPPVIKAGMVEVTADWGAYMRSTPVKGIGNDLALLPKGKQLTATDQTKLDTTNNIKFRQVLAWIAEEYLKNV